VVREQVLDVARAVEEGFIKTPKRLPSWLFYDDNGDKLFQQIMRMPEYYLTRSEFEILEANKGEMLRLFNRKDQSFNLIELGAGDGLKTEVLLHHFYISQANFIYTPVDVSRTVLDTLQQRIHRSTPHLVVQPINKRYEQALYELSQLTSKKVLLFLGANIGNFMFAEAKAFMMHLAASMVEGDQLVIGFDLKKDPHLV
jgi:uncharacterized SAM-dependent methyltransferase